MTTFDKEAFEILDGLIKERDFKEAFEQGIWYVSEDRRQPVNSAHVWFQLALVANLTKKDPTPY